MVGHYRIIEKIGAGGMGEVYLAEDTKLHRRVALKFLPHYLVSDEDAKTRFTREAQAAATLKHPNIVTIHEVSEYQGRPFFAMECCEGLPLRDLIKEQKLTLDQISHLAFQICEGLQEAHEAGIVHRDVKPSNIILDKKGRPKLVDFGLATIRGAEKLTKTGSTLGTIGYMSPEQIQVKEVDQRSDLFSFGVVLYEMITGRLPFKGDTEAATLNSVLNDIPEPLSRYKSGVAGGLQQIVSKLLEKDSQLRYQTAAGVISDLKRLSVPGTPIKKSRQGLWVGIATIVLIAVIALIITEPWVREPTAERPKKIMLAVLPFENLGAPEDEYFADGVTDEIISRLAALHGLAVISRTSTLQYKGTRKSIPEIGAELGADYILEGTVRWDKTDDESRVRINPQLIRVAEDVHQWADRYDAVVDDIFAVQSSIAEKVAEELDIALLESERQALADHLSQYTDAYDYYLRGSEYVTDLSETGLRNAESMFLKAIELEPELALAHAELSCVHTQMYAFYYDRTEERLAAAKEAVDRAFEIEPDLPHAFGALGWYYYRGDINHDKALEQFTILRKKRPSDGVAQFFIALLQRRLGKWEDCVENFDRAYKLDPRRAGVCREYGGTLLYLRRYAEAETFLDRAIDLTPDRHSAYIIKSWFHVLWNGDTKKARMVLQKALQATDRWPELTNTEVDLDLMDCYYDQALSRLTRPGEIGRPYAALDSAYYYNRKGDVYRYLNQANLMEACYDSARVIMERLVTVSPEEHWYRAYLALAYAGIGRKQDAVREAKLAVELLPLSEDALSGTDMLEYLAITYVMTGEYDLAIEQLDHLLSIPSRRVSAAYLAIWPDYAPLRNHPKFQALLEKYEKEHGT